MTTGLQVLGEIVVIDPSLTTRCRPWRALSVNEDNQTWDPTYIDTPGEIPQVLTCPSPGILISRIDTSYDEGTVTYDLYVLLSSGPAWIGW